MNTITYLKKDETERITFIQDDCAGNPRGNTDFPLHCADFCRSYSIMTGKERRDGWEGIRDVFRSMVNNYLDSSTIIGFLCENGRHMTDRKSKTNNALAYDRSERCWVLYDYGLRKYEWRVVKRYYDRKEDIDTYDLLENVSDETLEALAGMIEDVKFSSYGFGYYGEVSFSDGIDMTADGVAWIEREEFLKYTGCGADKWKGGTFHDLAGWLTDEIDAWADGEVYGFRVERRKTYRIHKECTSHDEPVQDYESAEWEETDSCWGFYGEFDKIAGFMFSEAGLNKSDFEEVIG